MEPEVEDLEVDESMLDEYSLVSDVTLDGVDRIEPLETQPKALKKATVGSRDAGEALDRALRWLAAQQKPDGSWPCAKQRPDNARIIETGLALLAFLGSGVDDEKRGKYRSHVRQAVGWLKKVQQSDGCMALDVDAADGAYAHAVATLALTEAAARSGLPGTLRSSRRSLAYTAKWFEAKASGKRDLIATAWMVLPLLSARRADLAVTARDLGGAMEVLEEVSPSKWERCEDIHTKDASTYRQSFLLIQLLFSASCRSLVGWDDRFTREAIRDIIASELRTPMLALRAHENLQLGFFAGLVARQSSTDLSMPWRTELREDLIASQTCEDLAAGYWRPTNNTSLGRIGYTGLASLLLSVRGHALFLEGKGDAEPLRTQEKRDAERLIRLLDNEDYTVRQGASRELAQMGAGVVPYMQARLSQAEGDGDLTLEQKQRLRATVSRIQAIIRHCRKEFSPFASAE